MNCVTEDTNNNIKLQIQHDTPMIQQKSEISRTCNYKTTCKQLRGEELHYSAGYRTGHQSKREYDIQN